MHPILKGYPSIVLDWSSVCLLARIERILWGWEIRSGTGTTTRWLERLLLLRLLRYQGKPRKAAIMRVTQFLSFKSTANQIRRLILSFAVSFPLLAGWLAGCNRAAEGGSRGYSFFFHSFVDDNNLVLFIYSFFLLSLFLFSQTQHIESWKKGKNWLITDMSQRICPIWMWTWQFLGLALNPCSGELNCHNLCKNINK